MSTYETLLVLHLLAAFATVASIVMFVGMLVGARRARTAAEALPLLRLSGLAALLWNLGGITVLVFGVWLALHVDGYSIVDGWVIAAIVLWLIASAAGGPLTRAYRTGLGEGPEAAVASTRTGRAVVLHVVMAAAALLLLVDMIYKPGT